MTSSIGRISNLPDPSPLERGGIEYGLSWLVAPETLDEATARIAQFRGLTEGEFVPVEASCRGRNMDGLYRVSSCDISEIAGAEDPNAPTPIRVDVSMVRVATGVVPAEVVITGVVRPVTAPVTAFPPGNCYGGVPRWVGSAGVTVDATLTTDTGATVHRVAAFAPAHIALGSDIPVANWLDGAATIEVSIGGTWWPLHGTTVPTQCDIRVGNGLVRVTLLAKKAGLTQNVDPLWEQWSGSVWQPVQLRQVDASLLVAWRAIEGVKVLRNDPGQLEIRVWGARVDLGGVEQTIPWQCVWAVKRGVEIIECTAEKIPVAWTTAAPVVASTYVSGAVHGGRFASSPPLAVLTDALAAVLATSPSNVRDGTILPGRWALCRLLPDTRAQWYRASTQQLRVLV